MKNYVNFIIETQQTTENFVVKANIVHDNKYDYSKTDYVKAILPVIITCPIHGDFTQRPNLHLQGNGCPECKSTKLTKETFIEKSMLIHGDKYDYSKTNYKNNKTKVIIICPEHGEFYQQPKEHLKGKGCPICGGTKKLSKLDFIDKAIDIHGNKYDYTNIDYTNNRSKLSIICPKHGEFVQRADSHLQGNGCPICQESKGERQTSQILKNHNINFIRQKTFPECKYHRVLPFDFYLTDYNICIEYDGRQHYEPIVVFGENSFINTQRNDKIKNEFCEKNNIPLIRIKYNENIGKVLEEKLFSLIKKPSQ